MKQHKTLVVVVRDMCVKELRDKLEMSNNWGQRAATPDRQEPKQIKAAPFGYCKSSWVKQGGKKGPDKLMKKGKGKGTGKAQRYGQLESAGTRRTCVRRGSLRQKVRARKPHHFSSSAGGNGDPRGHRFGELGGISQAGVLGVGKRTFDQVQAQWTQTNAGGDK